MNYTETIPISIPIVHVLQRYVDRAVSFNRSTSIELTAFHQTEFDLLTLYLILKANVYNMCTFILIWYQMVWRTIFLRWVWYDCITSDLYIWILQIFFRSYDFNLFVFEKKKHYLIMIMFSRDLCHILWIEKFST